MLKNWKNINSNSSQRIDNVWVQMSHKMLGPLLIQSESY